MKRISIIFRPIWKRVSICRRTHVRFSFRDQLRKKKRKKKEEKKKRGRGRAGYSYELLSWWCGGRRFAFPVQRISFGVLGSFPKQTKTGRLNGHRIATAAPNHRKRERNTNSTRTSAPCTSYEGVCPFSRSAVRAIWQPVHNEWFTVRSNNEREREREREREDRRSRMGTNARYSIENKQNARMNSLSFMDGYGLLDH